MVCTRREVPDWTAQRLESDGFRAHLQGCAALEWSKPRDFRVADPANRRRALVGAAGLYRPESRGRLRSGRGQRLAKRNCIVDRYPRFRTVGFGAANARPIVRLRNRNGVRLVVLPTSRRIRASSMVFASVSGPAAIRRISGRFSPCRYGADSTPAIPPVLLSGPRSGLLRGPPPGLRPGLPPCASR